MNEERINIAIAEACGRVRRPDGYWFPLGSNVGSAGIPNYCNDLNAMHEAEKTLSSQGEILYVYCLAGLVVNDERWDASELCSDDQCYRATARQRAEAFLKTLGKWEES